MDDAERIGCCELMCFGLNKMLEDDGILIPFSSSKILTILAICQIVYDPNCDELVVCVDHRTSCDCKISHPLEGRLSVVLVSSPWRVVWVHEMSTAYLVCYAKSGIWVLGDAVKQDNRSYVVDKTRAHVHFRRQQGRYQSFDQTEASGFMGVAKSRR